MRTGTQTTRSEAGDDVDTGICRVCDEEVPLDGKQAMERFGSPICRECSDEEVVVTAECESLLCPWSFRASGVEFNRGYIRKRAQQEANNHQTRKRIFEDDPCHTSEVEEVDAGEDRKESAADEPVLLPDGGTRSDVDTGDDEEAQTGIDTFTEHPILQDDRAEAVFSDDRTYRYKLWRRWDASKPTLGVIMLNPSTADENEDDNTIRRCINYAKAWGYGTLVVGNLFATRATNPEELPAKDDPVGTENDRHLREIVDEADMILVAWGTHGTLDDRCHAVANALDTDLYALDTTKEGHPAHPLYQPTEAEPTLWEGYDDG
jgi:hypothetical protein